jgi:hypothetical protein
MDYKKAALWNRAQVIVALDAARKSAPWMVPIFGSCLEFGSYFFHVPQNSSPFRLPDRRGLIVLIGDDVDTAFGPSAFDRLSISRALGAADFIGLVCCEPLMEFYILAGANAATGGVSVLIESRERFEADWFSIVGPYSGPRKCVGVGLVKTGGHA